MIGRGWEIAGAREPRAAGRPRIWWRGFRAATSVAGAIALAAGTLAGLLGLVTATAPPAGAAINSWTAYIYNLGANQGFVTPVNNVNTSSPSLGTNFNSGGAAGNSASGTSISPNDQYLFASNYGSNSVSVFLTATDALYKTLTTGISGPFDNAVSPDGTELWVANYGSSSVEVYCIASGGCNNGQYAQWSAITNINTTGGISGPIDVAVTPNNEYAYVANYDSDTVTILCANWSGCYGTTVFNNMAAFSPMYLYSSNCTTGYTPGCGIDWTTFTPDGQYAYIADCGDTNCAPQGDISMVQNAEGQTPTFVSRTTSGGYGTNQIEVAPNCTTSACTAYVTNFYYGGQGNIQVYSSADSGSFPVLQKTVSANTHNPNYFAITPDSKYLVVSDPTYGQGNTYPDQVDYFSTATDTVVNNLTGTMNNGWTVATMPDPAPVANLLAYPGPAGDASYPSYFDGSGSTTQVGTIASYAWNFGNGCTATTTGATIELVYPTATGGSCPSPTIVGTGAVSTYGGTVSSNAGTYTVTLTVTNSSGTSTTVVYTGHTVSNDGGPSAEASKTISLPTKLVATPSTNSAVTMASSTGAPDAGPITVQIESSGGSVDDAAEAGGPSVTVNLSSSPSANTYFAAYDTTTHSCDETAKVTSMGVPQGQGAVQVCFGSTTAGTYNLSYAESTGGLTSGSDTVDVVNNGAYQLGFTTSAISHICLYNASTCASGPTGVNGEMGPITVQSQNASGAAIDPSATLTVALTMTGTSPTSSGTATFYTSNGTTCNTATATSVQIPTTVSSVSFCFSYTVPDVAATIEASTTGLLGNETPTQVDDLAGPATKMVVEPPQLSGLCIGGTGACASGTTPDIGGITVAVEDASNYLTNVTASTTVTMSATNTVTGGTSRFCPWSGTSCSGSNTTTYTLASGSQSVIIGYGYNKGDSTATLKAAATGLTSVTGTEIVDSGPPTVLALCNAAGYPCSNTGFSGVASAVPNLGPITVQLEDAGGFTSPATSTTGTVTVTLSSSSTTGAFSLYTGGTCSSTILSPAQVTIAVGSFDTQICYGDTTAGSPTITAKTTNSYITTNTATQSETVTGAAPAVILINSGAQNGVVSSTPNLGPINVELEDQYGNPSHPSSSMTVDLASNATEMSGDVYGFSTWTGSACSTTILSGSPPTVTITTTSNNNAGAPGVSFCYGDETAGTPTLTTTVTGLTVNSATQKETVNASSPAGIFVSPSSESGSRSTSANLGPTTFAVEDQFKNPVKVATSVSITLTRSPTTGGDIPVYSLYSGSCSTTALNNPPSTTNVTATATIGAGSSQVQVCFGDNIAATYTLTGTTTGFGTNSASQTDTVTSGAGSWGANGIASYQEKRWGGDYFGVAQEPQGSQMIAVGDNSSCYVYCFGYGEVSVSAGPTSNFDVARVFDGNKVDAASMSTGVSDTVESLSCASSAFCAGVDGSGHLLSYSGSSGSWTSNNLDGSNKFNSVSCVSSIFCVAVDNAGNAFYWDGSWIATTSPSDTLTSVACEATSGCVAVDSVGKYLTYTSSTNSWSAAASAGTGVTLKAVSCESSTTCAAVDSAGGFLSYTVGTNTWSGTSSTGAASFTSSSALSCAWGSTVCAAFGGSTVYSNVSGSWASSATGKTLVSLSCVEDTSVTTTILCGATDTAGDVLYDDAGSPTGAWTAVAGADSGTEMTAISCVTGALCISGDTAGHALLLLNNGTNYSITTGLATGVGCVQTTDVPAVPLCVVSAVSSTEGAEILVSTDPTDPSSWVASTVPTNASGAYLDGASCGSGSTLASTVCVVVGYGGASGESGTYDQGGTLLQATGFTGGGSTTWADDSSTIGKGNVSGGTVTAFYGVSCLSATECYAAGKGNDSNDSLTEGVSVYYLGSGWAISGFGVTGSSGQFTGIDCVSTGSGTSDCFASGNSGAGGSFFDDTSAQSSTSSWTSVNNPTTATYLYAIGCTSASTTAASCYAAGYNSTGGVVVNEVLSGGTWSYTTPENFNYTETIWYGIDCASGLTCTAVGSNYSASNSAQYSYWPVAATGS